MSFVVARLKLLSVVLMTVKLEFDQVGGIEALGRLFEELVTQSPHQSHTVFVVGYETRKVGLESNFCESITGGVDEGALDEELRFSLLEVFHILEQAYLDAVSWSSGQIKFFIEIASHHFLTIEQDFSDASVDFLLLLQIVDIVAAPGPAFVLLGEFVVILDDEVESAQIVFDFVDVKRAEALDSGHDFNHPVEIILVDRSSVKNFDDGDEVMFLDSVAFDLGRVSIN